MLKTASVMAWISGAGFGLPCIYGIYHLWKGKGIAYVMGLPTYGQGPFEKIGVHSTLSLLTGFLLLCILECLAGQMLWGMNKGGAVLSLAIIPLELTFFIGFALPFGPPLLVIRTILVLLTWTSFN